MIDPNNPVFSAVMRSPWTLPAMAVLMIAAFTLAWWICKEDR